MPGRCTPTKLSEVSDLVYYLYIEHQLSVLQEADVLTWEKWQMIKRVLKTSHANHLVETLHKTSLGQIESHYEGSMFFYPDATFQEDLVSRTGRP